MRYTREQLVPGFIIGCTLLVAAWLALAHFSGRFIKPYELTFEDFVDFQPAIEGWEVQKLPAASQSAVDANIVAFSLHRDSSSSPIPSPSSSINVIAPS